MSLGAPLKALTDESSREARQVLHAAYLFIGLYRFGISLVRA
jgi:hypothetical protein